MNQSIQITDGCARVDGKELFGEINLSFEPGTLTCILGPNGAGKSSLLKALSGLSKLHTGEVRLEGRNMAAFNPADRARKVSYLPQIRPLAWPIGVADAVALGRFAYGASPGQLREADRRAVEAAIEKCDLNPLRQRRTDTLSGGELARVHMARVFASEAPNLLADEPLAALDPRHQLRIMDLLTSYCRSGGCAVVVMHDMALAARYADRLVWMLDGRVQADGSPTETLTSDVIKKVFCVDAKISGDQISLTV